MSQRRMRFQECSFDWVRAQIQYRGPCSRRQGPNPKSYCLIVLLYRGGEELWAFDGTEKTKGVWDHAPRAQADRAPTSFACARRVILAAGTSRDRLSVRTTARKCHGAGAGRHAASRSFGIMLRATLTALAAFAAPSPLPPPPSLAAAFLSVATSLKTELDQQNSIAAFK